MKLSKRLEAIASFIDKNDKIVDVGCDHGYLDIYLALYKHNKMIIATDISEKVIENTILNINNYKAKDKIVVYCTDGIKNIKEKYDTIVICGMGSNTIFNILKTKNNAKKLIISSNNNWPDIRTNISNSGFSLENEKLIYENKKLYSIMIFKKGKKKLKKSEKLIGLYSKNNKELYKIYLDNLKDVYNKIPYKYFIRKLHYLKSIFYLKKYLRKKDR